MTYQDYYGTKWRLLEKPLYPDHLSFQDIETKLFYHCLFDSVFAKTLKLCEE